MMWRYVFARNHFRLSSRDCSSPTNLNHATSVPSLPRASALLTTSSIDAAESTSPPLQAAVLIR